MYDQWQIWNVIGNPNNNTLINNLGKQIKYEIINNLLINKIQNGIFLDSCIHHCTSCSVADEDSWNGLTVKSTKYSNKSLINNEKYESISGLTPAKVFQIWYKDDYSSDNNNYYDSNSKHSLKNNINRHFYIQDFSYPCYDCCKCRAQY